MSQIISTDQPGPMPMDGIEELPLDGSWSLTAQLTKVEPTYIELRVLPPTTTEGLVQYSVRRLRLPNKKDAKGFWSQLDFAPAQLHRESRAGSLVLRNLRLTLQNKGGELTVAVHRGVFVNV